MPEKEVCSNGLDDDHNGLADCADSVCAAEAACQVADAGWSGPCARCGQYCDQQQACLAEGWRDTPLPQCLANKCTALLESVDVRLELNTSAWAGLPNIRSLQTRFVLKTALDRSQVTCATLRALVNSTSGADGGQAPADQIESSGRFNLLSYEATPVPQPMRTNLTQLLHVGTAANFLIWTELWSGFIDSNTKLPTGIRWGAGCFETGPAVAEVTVEDHQTRTIKVVMPPP